MSSLQSPSDCEQCARAGQRHGGDEEEEGAGEGGHGGAVGEPDEGLGHQGGRRLQGSHNCAGSVN